MATLRLAFAVTAVAATTEPARTRLYPRFAAVVVLVTTAPPDRLYANDREPVAVVVPKIAYVGAST
jgi:hypothetical protein